MPITNQLSSLMLTCHLCMRTFSEINNQSPTPMWTSRTEVQEINDRIIAPSSSDMPFFRTNSLTANPPKACQPTHTYSISVDFTNSLLHCCSFRQGWFNEIPLTRFRMLISDLQHSLLPSTENIAETYLPNPFSKPGQQVLLCKPGFTHRISPSGIHCFVQQPAESLNYKLLNSGLLIWLFEFYLLLLFVFGLSPCNVVHQLLDWKRRLPSFLLNVRRWLSVCLHHDPGALILQGSGSGIHTLIHVSKATTHHLQN